MIYSELKSIDAIMAQKQILQAKIAKQEGKIIRDCDSIKTYYKNKFKWVNVIRTLFSSSNTTSSFIGQFSLGYKLITYIIRKLKR